MNIIIFIAFVIGLFIVGYDGMFKESPSALLASGIVVISAIPVVFFQKRMKEKKTLLVCSVIGVTIGSVYLLWLTDGQLFSSSK